MQRIKWPAVTVLIMGIFIFPEISQAAATHSININAILPTDIDMVFELNTEVTNPMEELISSFIKDEIISSGDSPFTEIELNSIANENILTMAMDTANDTSTTEAIISLYLTKNQFEKIVALEEETSVVKEVIYNGYTMYIDEYDSAVVHLNNELFVLSSNTALLKKALDKTNLLANLTAYKESTAKDLSNSFFRMYLDPSANLDTGIDELNDMIGPGIGINETLFSAMTGESISVAQTGSGFKVNFAVKGDTLKIQQNNLTFNFCNFTPSLYRLVTGQNLMLYSEEKNWRKKIDDTLRMLEFDQDAQDEMDTMKTNFKTLTDIDIDTEIMPLFEQRSMITVHNTDSIIPGITLVLEAGTKKDLATGTMLKLFNYMKDLTDNDGNYLFTASTYIAGGTSYNELSAPIFSDATELSDVAADKKMIMIRMGVTSEGYLIISTAPDLSSILNQNGNGILDNTAVSTALGSLNQEISGVSFFSADTLQDYLLLMTDLFGTTASDIANSKDMINKMLNPWHDIYETGYATTDLAWSNAALNVTMEDFDAYADLISQFTETVDEELDAATINADVSFCDVKLYDWYYDYVYDLASHNIITGYTDGCFRPNNPITRAEYITLLMKATGKAAAINTSYKPFTDVPPIWETWYSEYVNMAEFMNFVDGYEDGSFKPNNYISRAEAVQILFNMSGKLPGIQVIDQPIDSLIEFNDVGGDDWFMVAVAAAKHYGLVSGVSATAFEPSRNITRAEAAKIVKLFLELENS
jgi:hypothetical protein